MSSRIFGPASTIRTGETGEKETVIKQYEPDYRRIEAAARNREAGTIPLYEHIISTSVPETILGRKFGYLDGGDAAERRETSASTPVF